MRVDRREARVLWQNPHLLLVRKDRLTNRLVAHVELTFILVSPFLEDVVRGVRTAGAEIHEERLVRRDYLGVSDELYGLVDEILRKVVSILRFVRLVDGMVIVDEIRVPLVSLAAHKPVEAFETRARAASGASTRRHLPPLQGSEMPFPHGVGIPPSLV